MAEYYKTLDDVVAAVKPKFDSAAKEKIDSYNADIDKATAIATQNAAAAEETTNKSYEDIFRKNRLNQIINEEKVKERMVNLGLTDSGLNRTQQTAIQLQAANADASAVRNRQAAIDEIRRGITEFTAQQEAKKSDYARETNDLAHQNMMSKATSIWNTQLENQQKAAEAKREAASSLMSTIYDDSIPNHIRAASVHQYVMQYENGNYDNWLGILNSLGYERDAATNTLKEKPTYSFVKSDDKKWNWFGGLKQRDMVQLVDNSTGKPVTEISIGDLANMLNRDQRMELTNLDQGSGISLADLGFNNEVGINNLLAQLKPTQTTTPVAEEPTTQNSPTIEQLRNIYNNSKQK